jgi:hypothetical protein
VVPKERPVGRGHSAKAEGRRADKVIKETFMMGRKAERTKAMLATVS